MAVGVQGLTEAQDFVGAGRRTDLATQWVSDAAQELHMCAVHLSGALTDPEHVGRAVVPVAGQGVLTGERLLVVEEERLVAGVEVDLAEVGQGVAVDAACGHELHGPVDLVGQGLVALAGGAGRHELAVPLVDAREGGEAALGERPEEVQRGGGPVVGREEALGVGGALPGCEADVVDDVPAECRQLDAVDGLGVAGTRLGELSGDATDLHHRYPGEVGEDDCHLQDDTQSVPDGVSDGVEGLGAVAGLQEEGIAVGHGGQPLGQLTGLAGEDQRR